MDLEKRKKTVGASEVAAVLGISPYEGPYSIWCRKTGKPEPARSPEEQERLDWGHRLEPVVLAEFRRRTGLEIEAWPQDQSATLAPAFPISATPDARITGTKGLLEIKTTSSYLLQDWLAGVPWHYVVQAQVQMACTRSEYVVFACLVGGQRLISHEIAFDRDRAIEICREVRRWWRDYVETGIAPSPDGLARTTQAITSAWRPTGDTEIELPADADEWSAELEEIAATAKALEARELVLKNCLRDSLRGASSGMTPRGVEWTWRENKKGARVLRRRG